MFSKQCKEWKMGFSLKNKTLGDAQSNDFKTKQMKLLFTSKHLAASLCSSGKAHLKRAVLNQRFIQFEAKNYEKKTCLWSENTPFPKAK